MFSLYVYSIQTIDVPQSATLFRYLERKEYDQAYRIACLGVTDSDWKMLATEALQANNLDIARKAFIRIRDLKYIEIVNEMEIAKKRP